MTSDTPHSSSLSSPNTPSIYDYSLSIRTSTTSSGSTIRGIGELSGKAILALGKATLRGADYLSIRRRLIMISSKFPHTNADSIGGVTQMYEDLLELSRWVNFTMDTAQAHRSSRSFPEFLWRKFATLFFRQRWAEKMSCNRFLTIPSLLSGRREATSRSSIGCLIGKCEGYRFGIRPRNRSFIGD